MSEALNFAQPDWWEHGQIAEKRWMCGCPKNTVEDSLGRYIGTERDIQGVRQTVVRDEKQLIKMDFDLMRPTYEAMQLREQKLFEKYRDELHEQLAALSLKNTPSTSAQPTLPSGFLGSLILTNR